MQTPSHLELALPPSNSCVDIFAEHVFFTMILVILNIYYGLVHM